RNVFPFEPPMYHTTAWNVASFCHTRSGLPSWFKSTASTSRQPPVPDASQSHPRKVFPNGPAMYHTTACRVESFCHTRSGRPSPLKSAADTSRQPATPIVASEFEPTSELAGGPLRYHTRTCCVASFWRSKSGIPSPLKSPLHEVQGAPAVLPAASFEGPLSAPAEL